MIMSISYVEGGRANQKSRTRKALVDAARGLMDQGITPTVEQAAVAARISRPTAYRYFPNQRALLVAMRPELAAVSLLGDDPPDDPFERLQRVAAAITDLVIAEEPTLRTLLRISLESEESQNLAMRSGLRITWVADGLQPLLATMPKKSFKKLVVSVAAVLGIEMLVWLTDVAGLSRAAACQIMRESAMTIARAGAPI